MVCKVSDAFPDIDLSLNIDKWEFVPYNCTTVTPLHCNSFAIPLVDCIRWLGICITTNLSSLRQRTVCDISKKIQIGYAKIVANRGWYNRRALENLNYLKFYRFLLYLPPWTKNLFLVRKFSAPDIALMSDFLHRKLSSTAYTCLSPHHRLTRYFRWFCDYICYSLWVFSFFLTPPCFFLCIGWGINKLLLMQVYIFVFLLLKNYFYWFCF